MVFVMVKNYFVRQNGIIVPGSEFTPFAWKNLVTIGCRGKKSAMTLRLTGKRWWGTWPAEDGGGAEIITPQYDSS
jgi:hypothetical protein